MRRIGALAVLTMLFTMGCAEKAAPPPPAVSVTTVKSAAPTPSATSSAPAPVKWKLSHCPNYAPGVTTTFNDIDNGVELVLVGKDQAAIDEVRKRAKYMADNYKRLEVTGIGGSGSGRGKFGRCPVVFQNTSVAWAETPEGAKMIVKAKDPAELDWLRREARLRQAEVDEPGGKEAVKAKMSLCPSAVPGAATIIRDTKEHVIVTVYAKDEKIIKAIRERGKLLLEAAKKVPKSVKDQGDLAGGLRRCPIIVTETTVTTADTAVGVDFIVVPDKIEDLYDLMKESRERGEWFMGNELMPVGSAAPAAGSGAPAAGSASKPPAPKP